jgi:hypothetical protein
VTSRGPKRRELDASGDRRFSIQEAMTVNEIALSMSIAFANGDLATRKRVRQNIRQCLFNESITYSTPSARTFSESKVIAWVNKQYPEVRHLLSHSDGRHVAVVHTGRACITEGADTVAATGRPRPFPTDIEGCMRLIEKLESQLAEKCVELERLKCIEAKQQEISDKNRISGGIRHPM